MADLATLTDVASALGVEAMSDSQELRAAVLLTQVSYLFALEAQRDFPPGDSTVRLRVINSAVTVTETPDEVTELLDDDDVAVTDYTVKGREVRVDSWPGVRPDFATITYSHSAPVPGAVAAAVAAIVARFVRVDPTTNPAIGVSSDLSAGDFRQRFADWVTKNVHLTEEDKATARSYRRPSPAMVMGT